MDSGTSDSGRMWGSSTEEENFREILENSRNVIYKVDLQTGKLVYYSKSFLDLFGISKNQIDDLDLEDIVATVHPDERPCALADVESFKRGEVRENRGEFRFRDSAGNYRWMKAYGTPILDDNGNPASLIVNLLDISKVKTLQYQLIKACDDFKSQIARDIHDNLQQIIGGILCFVDSLKQDIGDDERVCKNLSRLSEFIAEAQREAKRISRGLYPVDISCIGIDTALDNLCDEIEALFGISCVAKINCRDEYLNHNTSINLYAIARGASFNAGKHSNAENISIQFDCDEEGAYLQVSDDGAGYCEEENGNNSFGMGINIMHLRAESIGARLEITPLESGGTVVKCLSRNYKTD